MTIIEELQRCANGKCLCKKAMFNKEVYEYNGTSVVQQIIQDYGIYPELLNAELEEVEDKEYENIEELELGGLNLQSEKNGAFKRTINALIRNQKKIIERLDK